MGTQTKTIGRMPTDQGPYDSQLAYGKKFIVTLFDCGWESKHDNNTSAPATLNAQAGTITENTTDWKKKWGSYKQWLIDNGYQKMSAFNVKDGNNTQHDINAVFANEIGSDSTPGSIKGRVTNLEGAVGTGGSIDERIATEGSKHYLKSETYNKEEVNNLITTPNQEYVSVTANAQTTAVTDVLPSTGASDTTYRVGNWDGTQYNESEFSEYAWNGSAYIKLSTKSQVGEVYDISANHADAKYADLAAALNGGANIPQSLQKGGMSIKFVQSSDNKYVQYRLMADDWSVDTNDWSFCGDDILVENPEWIYVLLDSQKRILAGLKSDGSVEWSIGVPTPVKTYIDNAINEIKNGTEGTDLDGLNKIIAFLSELSTSDTLKDMLDSKVNKEEGKSLIDAEYADGVHYIENPEFAAVWLDSKNKIILGAKTDGTIYYGAGVPQQFIYYVESKINESKEDIFSYLNETYGKYISNPEFATLLLDEENKIMSYRKKDGTLVENAGVETKSLFTEDFTLGNEGIKRLRDLSKEFCDEAIEENKLVSYVIDYQKNGNSQIKAALDSYKLGEMLIENVVINQKIEERDNMWNTNQRMTRKGTTLYSITLNNIEGSETGVEDMWARVISYNLENDTINTYKNILTTGDIIEVDGIEYTIQQTYSNSICYDENNDKLFALVSAKINNVAHVVVMELDLITLEVLSTFIASFDYNGTNYLMTTKGFVDAFGYGHQGFVHEQFDPATTGWQKYNNEYYCWIFNNSNIIGGIFKTTDFIHYDVVFIAPNKYKPMHEGGFYIKNNYLYLAMRTHTIGAKVNFIKVDMTSKEIVDEVLIKAGMAPPYMFEYYGKLYLWCGGDANTNDQTGGRDYYKLIQVSTLQSLADSHILYDVNGKWHPENSIPCIWGPRIYVGNTGPNFCLSYFDTPKTSTQECDNIISNLLKL